MNWQRNSMGVRVVKAVADILEKQRDYLPFTLRQIHYQLVARNHPDYANTKNKYKELSGWLYDARIDGLIPWDAIREEGRQLIDLSGFDGPAEFLGAYLVAIGENYRRDLMQGQNARLEIWTEKDALADVMARFAIPYRVSVQSCHGFGSATQFDRVVQRGDEKPLRILYFGDHDPSGLWMSERDIRPRLLEKHSMDVGLERIALNPGQVQDYGLREDYQKPKAKDSRSRWYLRHHGDRCWELDALPPAVLGRLVQDAIESRIDKLRFKKEQDRERADRILVKSWAVRWRDQLDEG